MAVRGPDVSNHQETNDWRQIKASEWPFAAAKATEGTSYHDPYFKGNWSGMNGQGIHRIAYHFAHADAGRSGSAEARFFLDYIRSQGGFTPDDVPALDIEADNLSGSGLDRFLDDFCHEVERQWRPGLVYSGNWFLGSKGVNLSGPRSRHWELWTAAYGPNPMVFAGFSDWEFWQFTDGRVGPAPHAVPGVGACDINVFHGDVDELRLFFARTLPKHHYASRTLRVGDSGTDVQRLQRYCNVRLKRRGFPTRVVKADGVYGPETERAKHLVSYILGFPTGVVKRAFTTAGMQHYIRHPDDRPDSYRERAGKRAANA